MVVIAGRAKLANDNVDGKEVVLHFLGVGDICGEIAALDGKERAVDAIALEDADVFVVSTRDLLPTLAAHPDAMLAIIRVLCEKSPGRRGDHRGQHARDAGPHRDGPAEAGAAARTKEPGWRLSAADDLARGARQISVAVTGEREPATRSAEARQHDQDQRDGDHHLGRERACRNRHRSFMPRTEKVASAKTRGALPSWPRAPSLPHRNTPRRRLRRSRPSRG